MHAAVEDSFVLQLQDLSQACSRQTPQGDNMDQPALSSSKSEAYILGRSGQHHRLRCLLQREASL